MNEELEIMYMEAVMTYLKVLSWHSPERDRGKPQETCQDSISQSKFQSRPLPNRKQKHYCISELESYLYITEKPLFVFVRGPKKKRWIRENNRCGSHC
jgi:hypothetical protein